MCGIVALVGPRGQDLGQLAEEMSNAIIHRGPDDFGIEVLPDDGLALAMRRLSVVDLAGGHQPMWDEKRRHCLVFNGEIYNHEGLRDRLIGLGHTFVTDHSDTEVVVHGYEEWGSAVFAMLKGMFAVAIWDRDRQKLVLARDRAGEKPLYIAEVPGGFAVASEIKALLVHPELERSLDLIGLEQFLAFDFTVGPRTILQKVTKLPAGHFATISTDDVSVVPYWRLTFSAAVTDERVAVERLDALLDQSVRMRVIADVPLGIFLSGGLDSSTIGYYMSRHSDVVQAFTIGFDEREFDESTYAAAVARHLGLEHHVEVLSAGRVLDLLPRVTEILDEPMGDPSVFPTYLLSAFTRKQVTVALGGDGSDELLMGYRTYQALRIAGSLDRLPAVIRRAAASRARRLPDRGRGWFGRARRFAALLDVPPEHRLLSRLGSFRGDARRVLSAGVRTALPGSVFEEPDGEIARASAGASGWANRTIAAYVRGYLQEDILVKVDRASMAASLEVRAPFLDPDLMEFLGSLAPSLKLHGMTRKYLLRRVMRGRIPDAVIDRPKQGFGAPLDAWFRGPLAPLARDLLSPARLVQDAIFDPSEVQRLLDRHWTGSGDNGQRLWSLVQFQLWRDRWLSSDRTPTFARPSLPRMGVD